MKLRHMKVTRFEAGRFETGYLAESGVAVHIDKPPRGERGGASYQYPDQEAVLRAGWIEPDRHLWHSDFLYARTMFEAF